MSDKLSAKQQLAELVSSGSKTKTRRGPELITSAPPSLYSPNTDRWPKDHAGLPIPQINWAGLSIPITKANIHFLVGGVPGTGKTLTIRMLMQSVFGYSHPGSDRALIYDPKQEFFPILKAVSDTPERVKILNPFDIRCHAWDMAKDFRTPSDALQLAKTIIQTKPNSNNPFFPQAASSVLTALISTLIRTQRSDWDLFDVLKQCLNWDSLVNYLQQPRHLSPENMFAMQVLGDTKTRDNIKAELTSHLFTFLPIAALWRRARNSGRLFSLTNFLKSNDIALIGANQSNSEVLQAINRLLLQRFSEQMLDSAAGEWTANNRTWIILDELRELGNVTCVSNLINKGRSRGVCAVIGFQDYPGLQLAFGDKLAHEITASCAYKFFLRLEGESAVWASRHIGRAEIVETNYAFSGNTSIGISGSTGTTDGHSNSYSPSGNSYGNSFSKTLQHGFSIGLSQGISMSTQVRETDVVLPSEISSLPNFDRGGGLTGYLSELDNQGRACVRLLKLPQFAVTSLTTQSTEPGYQQWPDEAQLIEDLL